MEAVNGAATHEIRGGPGGVDETLYVRLKTSGVAVALTPIVEGYVDVGYETLQLVASTHSSMRRCAEIRGFPVPGERAALPVGPIVAPVILAAAPASRRAAQGAQALAVSNPLPAG